MCKKAYNSQDRGRSAQDDDIVKLRKQDMCELPVQAPSAQKQVAVHSAQKKVAVPCSSCRWWSLACMTLALMQLSK